MKRRLTVLLSAFIVLSVYAGDNDSQYDDYDYYPPEKRVYSKHSMGFRIGVGVAGLTGMSAISKYGLPDADYALRDVSAGYKFSWDAGFIYQYNNSANNFFFQSDILLYNSPGKKLKGVSKNDDDDITAMNIGSFEVQTYFGQKKILNNRVAFFVGGGPYLSFNYTGGYGGSGTIITSDEYYYDEIIDTYRSTVDVVGGESFGVRLFEVGANAMVGLEVDDIQIALSGQYGFTKILKDADFDSRRMMFKLTFSYILGLDY